MIFDGRKFCRCEETMQHIGGGSLRLLGEGLWIVLVRGDVCMITDPESLCRKENYILGGSPLNLMPGENCCLLAVRLNGDCLKDVLQKCVPCFLAEGNSCGNACSLMERLMKERESEAYLPYMLLCQIALADEQKEQIPKLIAEAAALMQEAYMNLYGVEELSEWLGVNKSYLVRSFSKYMGITPGKYLTRVKVEAVKSYLLDREYNLETIAGLCGFSGAHYLCRVFRKECGVTPQTWRNSHSADSGRMIFVKRDESIYL